MAYKNERPEIIAERLDLKINVHELLASLLPLMKEYPAVQRSHAMGGWAVQSTNQKYSDGWSNDFCPYNGPNNNKPEWIPRNEYENSLSSIQDYKLPTELSSPSVLQLLNKLEQLGLHPRKARIIKLTRESSSVWHTDGSKKYYQVRLHIPLITNPKCFFETDYGKIHMPADGSAYLVKINHNHRVVNGGDSDRFHFVVNIWDTRHISQYHQFHEDLNEGESIHPHC